MSKWSELAAKIRERDARQVEDINSFYGGGPTIENRIALADGRAQDALVGVLAILRTLTNSNQLRSLWHALLMRRSEMSKRMEQGSGAPSFCWECGKQLQRAPGKGLGLFYFRTVIDEDGNKHRVHGDCFKAIKDGRDVALMKP